jgi:hypothetical protein
MKSNITLCVLVAFLSTAHAQFAWRPLCQLKIDRHFHCAVPLSDTTVLVMGGYAGSQNGLMSGMITAACEVINVVTNTSRLVAPMQSPRAEFQALLLPNGHVLVVSGYTGSTYTGDCEEYAPDVDQWAIVGTLATPRRQHCATLLDDHRVLVVGGLTPGTSGSNSAEILDIWTGQTRFVAPYPFGFNLGVSGLTSRGHVLVTGGRIAGASSLRNENVYWYDSTQDSWVFTGNMRYRQCVIIPVQLLDGRLLIVGGSVDDVAPGAGDDVEIESGDTMRGFSHMAHARTWHSASVFNVDTVVAFGGHDYYNNHAALNSSEWIDVRNATCTLGPLLSVERKYSASASVKLLDCAGNATVPAVLAIGGLNGQDLSTTSVEVLSMPAGTAISPKITSARLRLCVIGDSITLDAGAGYGTYRWTTGDTTRMITVRAAGTYECDVHAGSCAGTASVRVTQGTVPVLNTSGALTCSGNDSVRIAASGGYASYLWSTGERTPSIVVHTPGEYRVTVMDTEGCVFPLSYNVPGGAGGVLAVDSIVEGISFMRDTLWAGELRCERVRVRNIGATLVTVRSVTLSSGLPLSLPAGEVPRLIPAGESTVFTVCILPGPTGRMVDTLVFSDSCAIGTLRVVLTVADLPLGFCHPYQELDTASITVQRPYPNPAGSSFSIPIRCDGAVPTRQLIRLRLESTLGTTVCAQSIYVSGKEGTSVEAALDVRTLPMGVYLLRVEKGRSIDTRLVVVRR